MRALYEEGIVEEDDLSFLLSRDLAGTLVKVKLEGELRCDLGVRIRVLKWMDARTTAAGRTEVLSTFYQYHAWQPARGRTREQSLIRCDQAHGEPHRHRFDAEGRAMACETLTLDTFPRLDAFVREAWDLANAKAESY